MTKILQLLLWLVLTFMVGLPTYAQENTPGPENVLPVYGYLFNETKDQRGPAGVEVMLHAWDVQGTAQGMYHGVSDSDGGIVFQDVLIDPALSYAVMAVYSDVTSYSDALQVGDDGTLPEIMVPVYEPTTDTTELSVDLHHLVIGSAQGGLQITELYALSNHGERAIVSAAKLEDEEADTLMFSLPSGAASVHFPNASRDRFIVYSNGFIDTAGVLPGQGTSRVIVSYVLSSADALTLKRTLKFDTGEISILLPQDLGLNLVVPSSHYQGLQTFGEEGRAFEVYRLGPLKQGEVIELNLSGDLPSNAPQNPGSSQSESTNAKIRYLAWGGILLGGLMLVGGTITLRRIAGLAFHEEVRIDDQVQHPAD